MAITLNAQTIELYDQIAELLRGKDTNLVNSVRNPIYESQLNMPTLTLKANAAAGVFRIQVYNGHLYPKTGTIKLVDTGDWDTEFVNYKRVINDTGNGNAPPSWNGVGNAPGAFLLLETALANTYAAADTVIYLADKQLSGTFPHTGSVLPAQMFASFLELIKAQVVPSGEMTATGGDTDTIQDTSAFTGVNSLVGCKITITDAGGAAPEDEVSYVISNTTDALEIYPALTAAVESGDKYTIEAVWLDTYIDELQAQIPRKLDVDGSATVGPAFNAAKGATTAAAAMIRAISQLGTAPTDVENRTRGQIGVYYAPFTTLTRKHLTGETTLFVSNADVLPKPATGTTYSLYLSSSAETVTMTKNYVKKNGAGDHKVDLSAGLGGDADIPCFVSWIESTAAAKKAQFQTGNPKMTAQAGLPSYMGIFQYFSELRAAVEAYTIPAV